MKNIIIVALLSTLISACSSTPVNTTNNTDTDNSEVVKTSKDANIDSVTSKTTEPKVANPTPDHAPRSAGASQSQGASQSMGTRAGVYVLKLVVTTAISYYIGRAVAKAIKKEVTSGN